MTSNSEVLVQLEKKQNVALVTLNRPDALNALNTAMREQLVNCIDALAKDDDIRVLVLTGSGRAFCAGLDLKELGSGETDNEAAVSDVNLLKAFHNLGKPVIGAINGFAITGGFELALMCDFMIVSDKAKFADTHSRVGIVPGWGLSQKLPRLIGINRAKQLSFTGNYLSAEKAERWGLVNEVVSEENLISTCLQMAEEIASCDARTLKTVKSIMDQGWDTTLFDGLRIEANANIDHMKDVSADALEERRKSVMKRGRNQSDS